MAIAGFDDIPMAGYINPPLTSVHVPIHDLGGRAITRLIEALTGRGNGKGRKELLPTTLVIRDSTVGPKHVSDATIT
jgi:DNA-binding LacI/PurR family transcriptional regulator